MNGLVNDLSHRTIWLIDYLLLASVLLIVVLAALAAIRQPVRRLAVTKSALAALALVAALSALPGWSIVHLIAAGQAVDASRPNATPQRPVAAPPREAADVNRPPREADEWAPHSIASPISPPPAPHWSWADLPYPAIAEWIFAAGAATVVLWLVIGAVAAHRLRLRAATAAIELVALFRKVAGEAPRLPQLLTSDSVDTAIALGVFQPAVVLPRAWTEQKSPQELASVLAHEWAHVKNGDLQWLAVSRALLVLLWVQPLYWLLRRRMRLDQEALADAAAADASGRQQYAAELVAWARAAIRRPRMPAAAAVGLWEGPSQLRHRIALLLDERFTVLRSCSRGWRMSAALALIAAACGLSLITVQPQSLAQRKVETNALPPAMPQPAAEGQPDRLEVFAPVGGGTGIVNDANRPKAPNSIFGQYRDEKGAPLAGVEVSLYKVSQFESRRELLGRTVTGADGSFRFAPAVVVEKIYPGGRMPNADNPDPNGPRLAVVARKAGRASSESLWFWIPTVVTRGVELSSVMRPAATLRGRVSDSDGKPIAGALVSMGASLAPHWGGVRAARTDARGNYVIDDVEAFDVEENRRQEMARREAQLAGSTEPHLFMVTPRIVTVEHPDFARRVVEHKNIPGTLDIQMQPGAVITGRVLNGENGQPLSEVMVLAARKRPPPKPQSAPDDGDASGFEYQALRAISDAEGRYRFTSLTPDEYYLWVDSDEWTHPGIARLNAPANASTASPEMALSKGGTIRVQLIDALTGEPLIDARDAQVDFSPMRAMSRETGWGTGERRATVDAEGRFEARHVAGEFISLSVYVQQNASKWELDVDGFQKEQIKFPIVIKDGETRDMRLHMRRDGQAESAPAANAAAPDPVSDALAKARSAFAANKPQDAKNALAGLVASDNNNVEVLLAWAEAAQRLGDMKTLVSAYERVLKLDLSPSQKLVACNNLAYQLAVCSDDSIRNGKRAVELAETARQLAADQGSGTMSDVFDTLAAAYAETGDFAKAIETQLKSIELAQATQRERLQAHLALYQTGKPLRAESSLQTAQPSGAKAPSESQPEADRSANVKPVEINLIVARYVMLLEGKKIVTKEKVEEMISALPDPKQAIVTSYISTALIRPDDPVSLSDRMRDTYSWGQQLEQRFGCQWRDGLTLRAGAWIYDSIRTAADLVQDESLRMQGVVQTADGKPLGGAEVVQTEPLPVGRRGDDFLMYLRGPRLQNRFEWRVTDSDGGGKFTVYAPKDKLYDLIVLHENGFAIVSSADFEKNGTITVRPWARVRGQILPDERLPQWIAGQSYSPRQRENALRYQQVSLQTGGNVGNRDGSLEFHLRGDPIRQPTENGQFEFNYVPPFEAALLKRRFMVPSGRSVDLVSRDLPNTLAYRKLALTAGGTVALELPPFTDEDFATLDEAEQRGAARRSRGRRGGAARGPTTESLADKERTNSQLAADRSADAKPVDIYLIVAKHVMLLDGREIVTREDVEKRIAALPNPALVKLHLRYTNSAFQLKKEDADRPWVPQLNARFGFSGYSMGSIMPRTGVRYDAIEKLADLVPDASLRKVGAVETADGKPLAGAEVVLLPVVPESVGYTGIEVYMQQYRLRSPLDEIVTASDEGGWFTIYPPKETPYYVISLHERGFGMVRSDQFARDGVIRVQPWGRITGQVKPDARRFAKQSANVSLSVPAAGDWPAIGIQYFAGDIKQPTADGRFEFAFVPPGIKGSLERSVAGERGSSFSIPTKEFQLAPGGTLTLDLAPATDEEIKRIDMMRGFSEERQKSADEAKKSAEAAAPKIDQQAVDNQPKPIILIVAKNLLYREGMPTTWANLERQIRELPDPKQAKIHILFSVSGAERKQDVLNKIEDLRGKFSMPAATIANAPPEISQGIDQASAAVGDLGAVFEGTGAVDATPLTGDPRELSGRVVDELGQPLAGVEVDAWTWVPGNEMITGADGRFSLKGFEPNEGVEIEFRMKGYSPALFVGKKAGTADWTVTLNNHTYLEGRVLAPDGKPVPLARVRAFRGPFTMPEEGSVIGEVWTEVAANDAGEYRLYLEPASYNLQMRIPNAGTARQDGLKIAAGEKRKMDIQLQAGPTFRATLVDSETGAPVKGIRLWNWMQPGVEGTSNERGELIIDNMLPGRFEFYVAAAADQKPNELAGEYARWWSPDAALEHEQFEDGSGRSGFQRNLDSLTFDVQPNREPVKIFLEKAAVITGRVVDPEGKPVAGATVAPAHTGTGNSLTGDTRYSVRTNGDGTFQMRLPASGLAKYNLQVHDGDYQQWRKWANGIGEVMQTRPGQELQNVELKLTRPCVVRGKVLDAQGQPIANQVVKSQPDDWMENRYYDPTTKTNEKGEFELKFVRAGKQYVQIGPMSRSPGIALSPDVVLVTADPDQPVEGIVLQKAPQAVGPDQAFLERLRQDAQKGAEADKNK